MLTGILSLLGIVPSIMSTIDGITKAIADEKIAALTATTDQERIHAQERISALQSRQAVLIAESVNPAAGKANAYMRFLLALGPLGIELKLELWDKVIGSFVGCSGVTAPGTCGMFITDPLDAHQWYTITAVIGFYFVADAWSSKK
jgi:hypothetical protein